jgi:hypothetical protein
MSWVDLGHSMTHAVVGLCRDETRTSEHVGISPAQEGNLLESQTDLGVQHLQSDRGREYMGRGLLRFYEKKGIQREQGPGYSPEVNGLAASSTAHNAGCGPAVIRRLCRRAAWVEAAQ